MMTPDPDINRFSRFARSSDGLRLHYFEYGRRFDPVTPVVCLPGLTRNAEDFDRLARVLAAAPNGGTRRVLSLDYRGRGRSDWGDPTRYTLQFEQEDILAVLAAAEVASAIFIGTSRGGLHIIGLSAQHGASLRGAVLNDIGPKIEMSGLLRIRGYIGVQPDLLTWQDAVAQLRQGPLRYFTNVSDADFETYARQTFSDENGTLKLRYDLELKHALDGLDPAKPPDPAPAWVQFDAMKNIPMLGIRGENSDILSAETFAQMAARHPAFTSLTVKGQGHAPLLLDEPTIAAITEFVGRIP
jgi:pimeloyl-ACP methyl ester carboxylesterase